jgi:hypothetical protein
MITPIFYEYAEGKLFVIGDANQLYKNKIIPDLAFPDNP